MLGMDLGNHSFFKGSSVVLQLRRTLWAPSLPQQLREASFRDTPCHHAFVMLSFMISPWPQASPQAMTWRYAKQNDCTIQLEVAFWPSYCEFSMPVHEYASREKQEVEWCRQRSIDHQSKRKHETTLSHEMDLDLWSEDTELPTPFFATPVPNEELADHFCLSPLAHISQCNFRFYEVTLYTSNPCVEQTSATKKSGYKPIWVNIIGLQPSYDVSESWTWTCWCDWSPGAWNFEVPDFDWSSSSPIFTGNRWKVNDHNLQGIPAACDFITLLGYWW